MGGLFQAFKYFLDLFFLAHFSWCHPLYLNRWNMLPEVWLSEREHCCDNPLILPAPPPLPPTPLNKTLLLENKAPNSESLKKPQRPK